MSRSTAFRLSMLGIVAVISFILGARACGSERPDWLRMPGARLHVEEGTCRNV